MMNSATAEPDPLVADRGLFDTTGVDEQTTWRALDELMKLPSLEEITAQNQQSVEDLRTQLSAVAPEITWNSEPDIEGQVACVADYAQTGGGGHSVVLRGHGSFPEAVHSQVESTIRSFAVSRGLDQAGATKSASDYFTTSYSNGRLGGVTFTFSKGVVLLAVDSGCYLSDETKENLRTIGVPNQNWPWSRPVTPRY